MSTCPLCDVAKRPLSEDGRTQALRRIAAEELARIAPVLEARLREAEQRAVWRELPPGQRWWNVVKSASL